jgi:ANTAR domain
MSRAVSDQRLSDGTTQPSAVWFVSGRYNELPTGQPDCAVQAASQCAGRATSTPPGTVRHRRQRDVTSSAQGRHDEVAAEVAKFAENRAVIEQAKGMLMSVYGICADSAFDLLKWRSQEGNVKLRLVAEQITHDFVALAKQRGSTPARGDYDNLLLTVDLRITDAECAGTPPTGEWR